MLVPEGDASFVDVDELRIGLFVHLDLGWMKHPFALGSFKITEQSQIATIRGLGLGRIRWSPEKSDPPPQATAAAVPPSLDASNAEPAVATSSNEEIELAETARQHREQMVLQRASLKVCERQFVNASRQYRKLLDNVERNPVAARKETEETVGSMVGKLLEQEESAIRLLSESVGDKGSFHAVNVTVLSLLLGKAMNLDSEALRQLGTGALLHDIGKLTLPDRLRWRDANFSKAERSLYQEHVAHGLTLGRAMGLEAPILTIMGQHHEWADGRGFPGGLTGDSISPLARIVGLVNHYDALCNPGNPIQAVTPHEALSLIFAQMKKQFDGTVLMQFIRMMGVYPPGSVIELNDGRFAIVVSVNSSRPLKPRILIHDKRVARDDAPVHDLEHCADIGIRRSLKPLQLPKVAYDYLSPRQRSCYFFERAQLVAEVAE
jgi:putative nucleotidyltransferase with HDIG domain